LKLIFFVGVSIASAYPTFTITNSSPDQTVAISSGDGIDVTGTYPNFTIALADAEYFTFTSATVAAQNYLAGATLNTLLTAVFTATTLGGSNWEIGATTSTLKYVGLTPKIYMMGSNIEQDSSSTAFRAQIYVTKEGVIINGNGFSIGTGGIAAGQTTAINFYGTGTFLTVQPNDVFYFSLNNQATGSLAGVSTNFKYVVNLAEAR
jgi:hypothetical protein